MTKEIQVLEPITGTALEAVAIYTGENGVEKILSDIKAELAKFTPDTSTAKGRALIATMSRKCSTSKVMLDDLGKGLVQEWKANSAKVDAARKVARDTLDALRDDTRKPLDEWEEAEAARLAAEKLAKEIDDAHAAAIAEHALFLRAKEIERKEAELAAIEAARVAKESAELAEREAAELAARVESERIANEARIRAEAEAAATLAAEKAAAEAIAELNRKAAEAQAALDKSAADLLAIETAAKEFAEKAKADAIASELKAERDRISAEEKAKADQAAAVAAAEQKARDLAAQVEADRKRKEAADIAKAAAEKAEAEKKAADVEHRRAVNKDVLAGLVAAGLSEKSAKDVITAIVGGLVKNVSINY